MDMIEKTQQAGWKQRDPDLFAQRIPNNQQKMCTAGLTLQVSVAA